MVGQCFSFSFFFGYFHLKSTQHFNFKTLELNNIFADCQTKLSFSSVNVSRANEVITQGLWPAFERAAPILQVRSRC